MTAPRVEGFWLGRKEMPVGQPVMGGLRASMSMRAFVCAIGEVVTGKNLYAFSGIHVVVSSGHSGRIQSRNSSSNKVTAEVKRGQVLGQRWGRA